MRNLRPFRQFDAWLNSTAMSESEKAECRSRAERGFAREAELLVLASPGNAERQLRRALGLGPARRGYVCRVGRWRFRTCPAGACERKPLTGLRAEKTMLLFPASVGKGSRLRARRCWKQVRGVLEQAGPDVLLLGIQVADCVPCIRSFRRQEEGEALLQQTAEDCLGKVVPILTICAGRQRRERARLWYQLAKRLS